MRACFAYAYHFSLGYEKNKFTGSFGGIMNGIIDYYTQRTNFTLFVRSKGDGLGTFDPSTGLYDGCIGRLQQNQSDLLLQMTEYPVEIAQIQQGHVAFDSTMQFITVYHPRKMSEINSTPIESCFASFDKIVWVICLSTGLIIHALLLIRNQMWQKIVLDLSKSKWALSHYNLRGTNNNGRKSLALQPAERILRKKKHHFSQIWSHMTRFGSLESPKGVFKKVIFTCCSIFSLLVVHYFCSYIKTELVTIEPPEIHRSYQELIDRRVASAFTKGLNNYLTFKFAPDGSKERAIWDISVSRYPEDVILISTEGLTETMKLAKAAMKRKMVFFIDSFLIAMNMKQLCDVFSDPNRRAKFNLLTNLTTEDESYDGMPIWSQDTSVRPILRGLIFSESFKGPAYDHVSKRSRRFFETGFAFEAKKRIESDDTLTQILGMDKSQEPIFNKIRLCREGVIKMPEVHLTGVTLKNFSNFIIYCLLLHAVSLVFFMIEVATRKFAVSLTNVVPLH